MTILSDRGNRSLLQKLTPFTPESVIPTGAETRSAAFEHVKLEEVSISEAYFNEGYDQRYQYVDKLVRDGVDLRQYQQRNGAFQFNRFAEDTGLVKTDRELFDERALKFKERRDVNQDIMSRGGGGSKFLGMAGGYMSDPINFSALFVPIGPGGGKAVVDGMSILAKSLITGRNAMGVSLLAETAIQRSVYEHKQDIQSPYTFTDMLAVIGITTLSAGILTTGLTAGISGIGSYFKKTSNTIAQQQQLFPRAPFSYRSPLDVNGKKIGAPTLDNISKLEQKLILEAKEELLGKLGSPITRGERKSLIEQLKVLAKRRVDALKPAVKYGKDGKPLPEKPVSKKKPKKAEKIEKNKQAAIKLEVDEIDSQIEAINKILRKDAKDAAANRQLSALESNGTLPKKQQKQLNDYITKNTSPEKDALFTISRVGNAIDKNKLPSIFSQVLNMYGVGKSAGLDAVANKSSILKAIDSSIKAAMKSTTTVNGEVVETGIVKQLQKMRDLIAKTSDEKLDDLMVEFFKKNVADELEVLKSREAVEQALNMNGAKPDDFVGPPTAPSPKAKATSMEREVLDEAGLGKIFDNETVQYNAIEFKLLSDGETIVDPQAIIKTIDEELGQLENILRCTRG